MGVNLCFFFFVLKVLFNYFLERGREGEKHQCVVASCTPPTGDLAQNSGMFPAWELNLGPFGSQAGTQSTEPHKPGQKNVFLNDRKPIST